MNLSKLLLSVLLASYFSFNVIAQNCKRPVAKKDLDINMVRATMLTGGDMWWDRNTHPQYEIPKDSKRNAIYAGGIWIGGMDAQGNLKVAAQTYHQTGDDFWAGPIDSTGQAQCDSAFDRIWSVKRTEVEAFISGARATPEMQEWPGINPGARVGYRSLAPFVDVNGDGKYNTNDGDYPPFAGKGAGIMDCDYALHGDQALWWVINDVGNVHTESGGKALGVEIQVTAYAFSRPGDALDSTTFYRFRIINKSSEALQKTFFSIRTDTDLGNPADDYVGCDVSRGMAYTYNGDETDEDGQEKGYSTLNKYLPPPALGIDFLRGPMADANDGTDNDHDGIVDEIEGEYLDLTHFLFYDGDPTVTGHPTNPPAYYNYMQTIWIDNVHMIHGGTGYPGSPGTTNINCNHTFPGTTDPTGISTGGITGLPIWSEETAGSQKGDRALLNSSGPFTLAPGQIATLHAAVEFGWAASGGNALSSVAVLQHVSDKIQKLFDACFSTLYTSVKNVKTLLNSIYPNPATQEINIHLNYSGSVYFTLYNLQGQIVFTQQLTQSSASVDVSQVPRGLYMYMLKLKEGKKECGKIILN